MNDKRGIYRKKVIALTVFLTIFITALTFIHAPQSALACSCAMPGTVQEEYKKFDFIFFGEAITRQSNKIAQLFKLSNVNEPYVTTFDVRAVYKGKVHETTYIYSGMGGGDCGIEFQAGTDYVVFARAGINGDLTASICSLTQQTHASSSVIVDLTSIASPTAPIPDEARLFSGGAILRIIVIILIGVIAFVIFRRKLKRSKK